MLLTALGRFAPPAYSQQPEAIHLQALVPTSGEFVERLLDGRRSTGWKPIGDPAYEGVLFRFEKQTSLSKVRVLACKGASLFKLIPYVNTVRGKAYRKGDENRILLRTENRNHIRVKSLFLAISRPKEDVCLGEVLFEFEGALLPVKAPRSIRGTVAASSTLEPAEAYHKSYLFDHRTDFGWVEGAEGLGVGESVTILLERPTAITALEVWNGYQRSRDHFRKNARARQITLHIDDGKPIRLALKDKMGPQKIGLKAAPVGKKLRLQIEKVAKGTRYKDLVISELRLWDEQGPLPISTTGITDLRQELESKTEGTKLGKVLNKLWTGRCRDLRAPQYGDEYLDKVAGKGRFKLRSNHTFVYYNEYWRRGSLMYHEVFDGTWVPNRVGEVWSEVKLYGRRNTQEKDIGYDYELNVKLSRTKVAGGSVNIAFVEDLGFVEFKKEVVKWLKNAPAHKVACLHSAFFDVLHGGKPGQADEETLKLSYQDLVNHSAVIIKGRAITDLLWRENHQLR
jgi:hypothetical protein